MKAVRIVGTHGAHECLVALAVCAMGALASPARAEPPNSDVQEIRQRNGTVEFVPGDQEEHVVERFRMSPHRFEFRERYLRDVSSNCVVSRVTFPSPVESPHEVNNTVHCEYFRPKRGESMPGVIVLHILGGDFELSRVFCYALVQRGVASMLVKMPYYGPRRPAGVSRRMISDDPRETVEGMTQAVLDIRRAVAWMEAQPEIDGERLGVFGISLGGITGALVTTAEPKLRRVCLLLAGGDVGQIAWESPKAARARRKWLDAGGTRQQFVEQLRTIDPVVYADRFQGRHALLLNARDDEVIPRQCTIALWEAMGRPKIVWYEGGHYSVAVHLLSAVGHVMDFFDTRSADAPDEGGPDKSSNSTEEDRANDSSREPGILVRP